MDKNEAKLLALQCLSNLEQAKTELVKIKTIANPQEKQEKAKSAYDKHYHYSQSVIGYYNSYNLSGEIDSNIIGEYDWTVKQLRNLSHEVQDSQKQNQTNRLSHCAQCNKKSKVYHFIWDKRTKKLEKSYSNATDLNNEWVFCNQNCFNEWYKKWWSSFENELKDLTCKNCKNKFQVEREYKRGKEITKTYDFCSQKCLNSWNQNNSKEQNNKKQCSGCSTLLTSEEICYCANCSTKQEQIRKNLDKNSQDINNMVGDFNNGFNNYVENQRDNSSSSNLINKERNQLQSQKQQLQSEIRQLETNPTSPQNQTELANKRKQLQEIVTREKNLNKSLPLNTQISLLEREIKELENKSNKTPTEQTLLDSKKKRLEELLKKQSDSNTNSSKPSDKTGFYIGCGVIGLFALLLIFILARNRQKTKKY